QETAAHGQAAAEDGGSMVSLSLVAVGSARSSQHTSRQSRRSEPNASSHNRCSPGSPSSTVSSRFAVAAASCAFSARFDSAIGTSLVCCRRGIGTRGQLLEQERSVWPNADSQPPFARCDPYGRVRSLATASLGQRGAG